MGIPVSLILIAAGWILTWGVTDEPSGLDLDAIGVILIVIGIVALILTLLLWRSWWGPGYWSRTEYVGDAPGYGSRWGRRRTYVEDEGPPPPPASPPPP